MSPAWSGSPERCEYMSPTVTIWVTTGSDSANHGSLDTIGVSQPIAFSPDLMGDHRRRRPTWTPTPAGTRCPGRLVARPSVDVLDAEALGVHRLSTVHDGDRHAGDAGLLHQVVGDAVELGDRVVDRVVRQRHRGHQRRRHVGQRGCRSCADGVGCFGRSRIARRQQRQRCSAVRPVRKRGAGVGSQPAR